MRTLVAFALVAGVLVALAASRADDGPLDPRTPAATTAPGGAASGRTTSRAPSSGHSTSRAPSSGHTTSRAPRLRPARCPAAAVGCRAVTGTVVAIESVDPDGDGDLHVVAAGGGVTAPGITVFDVRKDLRPARDPRPGDRVTGAGPVFRGSFGQRQIEVTEFRTAVR